MVFVKRKLDGVPQTLGEKLRALRRGQAVSMEMMEKETQIQHKYLIALERGDYPELPEPIYTRNFIRAYVRALKSDETYFLELYEEECGLCDLVEPMQTPRQRVNRLKFLVWNKFVKFALLLFVAVAIFGYLGLQIKAIVAPPEIILFSPVDSSATSEPKITVEGYVDREATVFVNGTQVVVDEESIFKTQINLDKGLNVIKVEAERRYSKRALIERRVVFDIED